MKALRGVIMYQNLIISANAVLPLILCMAAGYLFRIAHLITEDFCRKCNTFCFKTFLPLMIFMNVYNSDLESAVQPNAFIFAAAAVLTVFALAFLIIPHLVKKDSVDSSGEPVPAKSRQAVLIQAIFRSNFVIFGYQVVANVYGSERAAVASVMAAIVVPLYTVLAVITLEYFTNSKNGIGSVLKGIAKNPLIWGAILAFAVKLPGITIPKPICTGLGNMAAIATPLSLVVLGGTFHFNALKRNAAALLLGAAGKIVLSPLIMVPIAALLGFRDANLLSLMIVFASPTAVNSYTMADAYGHDPELAGQLVVMTSIFSMGSVFVWILILQNLGLIVV